MWKRKMRERKIRVLIFLSLIFLFHALRWG